MPEKNIIGAWLGSYVLNLAFLIIFWFASPLLVKILGHQKDE